MARGAPGWSNTAWAAFREVLLAPDRAGEHWPVWVDWYEDRLAGLSHNRDLEQDITEIEEGLWEEGPAVVNPRIAGLIQSYAAKAPASPSVALDDEAASTLPSIHTFYTLGDGRWAARPAAVDETVDANTEQIYQHLKNLCADLVGRLSASGNVAPDPLLVSSVSGLLEALGDDVSKVRPGEFISHGDMLDLLAKTFQPGSTHHNLPDMTCVHLAGLAQSMGRLRGLHPQISALYNTALANNIAQEDLARVADTEQKLANALADLPELVDPSVHRALLQNRPVIERLLADYQASSDPSQRADIAAKLAIQLALAAQDQIALSENLIQAGKAAKRKGAVASFANGAVKGFEKLGERAVTIGIPAGILMIAHVLNPHIAAMAATVLGFDRITAIFDRWMYGFDDTDIPSMTDV